MYAYFLFFSLLFVLPLTSTFSFWTVSVIFLVSVTGFFFTTTSSFTYSSFVISTSSVFKGTLISVSDSTGLSLVLVELGFLRSTTSFSFLIGTSKFLCCFSGSFVIVTSSVVLRFETFILSSTTGIVFSLEPVSPTPRLPSIITSLGCTSYAPASFT